MRQCFIYLRNVYVLPPGQVAAVEDVTMELLPVGSDNLLAVLSPFGSVAWILLVMPYSNDPYRLRQKPKKKMDWESIQIAPAATCSIEMVPFRVFPRVLDGLGQFLPK